MDELIIWGRALLVADSILLAIYQAAGGDRVRVVAARQRAQAVYPVTVIGGDDGRDVRAGDTLPKFWAAALRLEFYARLSDADPTPLATRNALYRRTRDLLVGNPALGLPGLTGQTVGADWKVCAVSAVANDVPDTEDETVARKDLRLDVTLMRLGL